MVIVSRTTYLNMVPSSVRPVVYVSQYDVDTSCLYFYLYNGSDMYAIPDGYHVFITGAKPDATLFSYDCAYSGNLVVADLKEQMTLVEGDVTCEISIQNYSTGQVIGTANFIMRVEESPWFKATMSKTDIDNLHDIIKNATDEATNRAETAASSANASAQNSASSANSSAASASAAQKSLNDTLEAAVSVKDAMTDTKNEFVTYVSNTANEFKEEAKNLAEEYSREAAKDAESWAVGGTGTRTGEDMNNSKYYAELSESYKTEAENSAKLAKDYSTIVMPDLYLDADTGIVYEKTGVGIDVQLDEDTAYLYWKITVG